VFKVFLFWIGICIRRGEEALHGQSSRGHRRRPLQRLTVRSILFMYAIRNRDSCQRQCHLTLDCPHLPTSIHRYSRHSNRLLFCVVLNRAATPADHTSNQQFEPRRAMSRSRPSVSKRTREADIVAEDARAQRHKKVDEGVSTEARREAGRWPAQRVAVQLRHAGPGCWESSITSKWRWGGGSNSAISTATASDTVTDETQRPGSPRSSDTRSSWSYF
jgi:hypothetical protein